MYNVPTPTGYYNLLRLPLVCSWSLSHVWFFVTPWIVIHQAPLSIGYSRQDTECCCALLRGICPTQGWNLCLCVSCIAGGFSTCCCFCITSVVSNSVWSHRLQPTRLLRPWDFPGKSTEVGCHCLPCLPAEPPLMAYLSTVLFPSG